MQGERFFTGVIRDVTARKEAAAALRDEQRQVALLAEAAAIANSASSFSAAALACLRLVAEAIGWPVGHALIFDGDAGGLVSSEVWLTDGVECAALFESSRRRFGLGEGLPGRVWASGRGEWIADVTDDENFPRATAAAMDGLRAAFAVPVWCGDQVCGVLEFFNRHGAERPLLMATIEHVGVELGRVLDRKHAAAALASQERRFRAIVEQTSDLVVVIDNERGLCYVSPSVMRLTGLTCPLRVRQRVSWCIPKTAPPSVTRWRRYGRSLAAFSASRSAFVTQPVRGGTWTRWPPTWRPIPMWPGSWCMPVTSPSNDRPRRW